MALMWLVFTADWRVAVVVVVVVRVRHPGKVSVHVWRATASSWIVLHRAMM